MFVNIIMLAILLLITWGAQIFLIYFNWLLNSILYPLMIFIPQRGRLFDLDIKFKKILPSSLSDDQRVLFFLLLIFLQQNQTEHTS